MTEQTYVRPVNYFEGDRVRIIEDRLEKRTAHKLGQQWIGRTGTVTKGSGRAFNEGVNVVLDRPVGIYDRLWFRHSEVEFEDNRKDALDTILAGEYVHTPNFSHCNNTGDWATTPEDKRWFLNKDDHASLKKIRFLTVVCPACGDNVEMLSTDIDRQPSFMCMEPSLLSGETNG